MNLSNIKLTPEQIRTIQADGTALEGTLYQDINDKVYKGHSGGRLVDVTDLLALEAKVAALEEKQDSPTATNTTTDVSGSTTVTEKTANYTAVTLDYVWMTTGATDKTVTLPLASENINSVIEVKKVDTGVGAVSVESADLIDGDVDAIITIPFTSLPFHCNGITWSIK